MTRLLTSEPSKLTAPIKTTTDKYELLPAFLRVKGFVRQHLESFNYLIQHEIKKIVAAKGNREIRTDTDRNFFLRYTDIFVGKPCIEEDYVTYDITPQQCRLRDITYSAPISVNLEYTKGKEVIVRKGKEGTGCFTIGRIPMMLRSRNCVLYGKNEAELAALGECPLDPGGYFVVRGTERVIMIQEQLSKNRIILTRDAADSPTASVTSSTHERKSKTNCIIKHHKFYLKHNAFGEDLNVIVVLKAMGIQGDQECLAYVGTEEEMVSALVPTVQECKSLGVHTQQQALDYIGAKIKAAKGVSAFSVRGARRSKADEARDVLAGVVLAHVPVTKFNFEEKAQYLGLMVRRMAIALYDPREIDDMDYYGNKRL